MNQNGPDFKEEIDLFLQMLNVENQFECLLEVESMYYTLSKKDQELIYEKFKKLLRLKYEKDKFLTDDFFFDERGYEVDEPNYCKSKLYQELLNRYNQEQLDKLFELDDEFQKLSSKKQKETNESVKRLLKNYR